MTGEYWVFRYIEDLARQETRNVGILLRTREHLLARFVGEREDGSLDLRTVRGIVRHTGAYKEWIDYWRYCLTNFRDFDAAVAAISRSGRGNYVVSEKCSVALPDVRPAQALSHLFHALVTEFPTPRVEEFSLTDRVDEILSEYRLRESPHFREAPVVPIDLDGVVEHVRPSYAWVNGHEVFFQKVSISAYRPEPTQKDVHNAAWIFEKLRESKPNAQTKALVRVVTGDDLEQEARQQASEYVDLLSRLSTTVINVDADREVDAAFAPLRVA